jgi:hypothetical protein
MMAVRMVLRPSRPVFRSMPRARAGSTAAPFPRGGQGLQEHPLRGPEHGLQGMFPAAPVPARPSPGAASSGRSRSRARASARAGTSPGGASRPVSPWRTSSVSPPTAGAATGRPAAMASSTALGDPSRAEDRAKTRARASSGRTSGLPPANSTRPARSGSEARASREGRNGPSPAKTSRAPGRSGATRAKASSRARGFLSGTSRATLTTSGPGSASAGEKRSQSTALGTTATRPGGAPWRPTARSRRASALQMIRSLSRQSRRSHCRGSRARKPETSAGTPKSRPKRRPQMFGTTVRV